MLTYMSKNIRCGGAALNSSYIIILLLFVFAVWLPMINLRRRIRRTLKKRRKTGGKLMNELIQSFVGKECAVACAGLYSYVGTIEEAKENWITLREKNGTAHLINLDYVHDVKEVKRKQK